jgi:hypothetical protein
LPPRDRFKIKYQFFVSSTYADLHEERNAVIWEILKAKHIPVGMEVFPAADDRGWNTIKRTIDDSDYYIILLGGRYGSIDSLSSESLSWTHKEYRYAREQGMKVIPFLRNYEIIPNSQTESDPAMRERLQNFRKEIEDNHHRKIWKEKTDLATMVTHAIRDQIYEDELDDTLPKGWTRGDQAYMSHKMASELAQLSAENRALRETVRKLEEQSCGSLALLINEAPFGHNTIEHCATEWEVENTPGPLLHQDHQIDRANSQLRKFARTHWLHTSLKNAGTVPIRGIVIDLITKDSSPSGALAEVIRHPYELPALGVRSYAVAHAAHSTDSITRHAYIDNIEEENGGIRSRIRVREVVPGATEPLPAIGVVLNSDLYEGNIACCAQIAGDGISAFTDNTEIHFRVQPKVISPTEYSRMKREGNLGE